MERDEYISTAGRLSGAAAADDAGRTDQRRRTAGLFRRPGVVPRQAGRAAGAWKPSSLVATPGKGSMLDAARCTLRLSRSLKPMSTDFVRYDFHDRAASLFERPLRPGVAGRGVGARRRLRARHDRGRAIAHVRRQVVSPASEHIERLFHSLAIVGVDPGLSFERFADDRRGIDRPQSCAAGRRRRSGTDDVCHARRCTEIARQTAAARRFACTRFRCAFDLWADKYLARRIAGHDRRRAGVGPLLAAGTEVPQPHALLPGRSAGRQRDIRGSRALMVDDERVCHRGHDGQHRALFGRRGTPDAAEGQDPAGHQPGRARGVGRPSWAIKCGERDLQPADVAAADEVFLTSTSPCMCRSCASTASSIGRAFPVAMFDAVLVGLERTGRARHCRTGTAIRVTLAHLQRVVDRAHVKAEDPKDQKDDHAGDRAPSPRVPNRTVSVFIATRASS